MSNIEFQDGIEKKDLETLRSILSDERLVAYEKERQKFNTFEVLGVQRRETIYTRTLAWLLDTNGTHGLGASFLESFIEQMNRLIGNESKLDLTKIEIFQEHVFPQNEKKDRLDLLITGNDWLIAIEAKINSSEGKNQTKRYGSQFEKDAYNKKQKIFLYLTIDNTAPDNSDSDNSKNNATEWKPVSWLTLVGEPLAKTLSSKDPVEDTVKPFLLMFLDSLYQISSAEFSDEPNSMIESVSKDIEDRTKYLTHVRDLINSNKEYVNCIRIFKDKLNAIKRSTGLKIKEINEQDRYLEKLEKISESKNLGIKDFPSTFQFLLDQVKSTPEDRIFQIKDLIKNFEKSSGTKFEVTSDEKIPKGTTNTKEILRFSFIPKKWLDLNNLKNELLIFLVEYKAYKNPAEIECKLYFVKSDLQGNVWRKNLWEKLKREKHIFQDKSKEFNKNADEVKIISFSGKLKDINDFENYKKALEDEFHKKFIPAIDLIGDANKNI